jgi:bifunctional non-homologous end joining protein LigD
LERLTKVRFTNLDKVLFPKPEIRKAQVIEYYIKVAPRMLGFLADRPVVTTRYPDGINQEGFYEKDKPKGTPSWVKTFRRCSETAKRNVDYVVVNNLDTLLWLANLAALEIHIPLSRVDAYEKPDLILFDVDPEPPADFDDAIEVAQLLKEKLNTLSLEVYLKTSGKKGLHLVLPVVRSYSFKQTREFVHQIGKHLASETEFVVSEFSRSRDPCTVYIDYLQNSTGRTMICPYSLRAEEEATVSIPLEWRELKKGLKPQKFNISSVLDRELNPWEDLWKHKQKLEVK